MDIDSINSAIQGVKVASEIIKGLVESKSSAALKERVGELQAALIDIQGGVLLAQSEQAALIQAKRNLEEEVVRLKNWDRQRARYKLTPLWEGVSLVYALQEAMSDGEPPHYLCTKCYEGGARMILQSRKSATGHFLLSCPNCKAEVHSGFRGADSPRYA